MADPRKPLLWLRSCSLVKWLRVALAVSWLLHLGFLLGSWGLEGRGRRRRRSEASPRIVHSGAEVACEPWGGVLSPHPLSSLLELLFLGGGGGGASAQQHALIAEHLCCAKTQSHLPMKTAEAKERASSVSLGPMWVSPPKVRADVIIRSPPPCNLGPYVETDNGARVTPRPEHPAESGRGCWSVLTAAQHPGGVGWEEGKGWPKGRGGATPPTCSSQHKVCCLFKSLPD